jgi:hypothetical protein
MADADALIRDTLRRPDFRHATFAGPARTPGCRWTRVTVRPVHVRGDRLLQFAYFDGRQTLTRNHPVGDDEAVRELVAARFAGVHLTTTTDTYDVRTTKKGRTTVGRSAATAAPPDTAHNRTKDVPLPEGRPDRLLELMGVATADGRVKTTMRAKFTQINEFLKHLAHLFDPAAFPRPVRILDCGSGAGYLTLAVHHYLVNVRNIPAEVVGVDVNDALIRACAAKAEALTAGGLTFTCGRIGSADAPADIVLALHACDTATDDALAQAVRSRAKLILSVPCCHKHLNRQMPTDGPLRAVLRHGILRERTADQVTDALRAAALRVRGYRTEVVEFVALEHTARNLMIRAVAGGPVDDPAAVAEYEALKQFWGVTPYVERVLFTPEG